ncbi:hypothetical protein PIB30_109511 [Stylosanthes scabra]|uniref:Uncharacterized protein n=1 Tax=Stylosanthes scabra TaxID=79078 RepID=A0ABU6Z2L5_9FABA|nr:hypothetical protein [Stylosanthes scabra]
MADEVDIELCETEEEMDHIKHGDFSDAVISDDSSFDGYESAEDEPYKPPPAGYDDSSDGDDECDTIRKQKGKAKMPVMHSSSKKKNCNQKKKMTKPHYSGPTDSLGAA